MNEYSITTIESKDLSKAYTPGKNAVDKVSFRLEKGKVYAFLGPNGSGKTTWMKMAAGLIKPTSGEILYEGKPIGKASKADVAYAGTEPFFYNWMSVKELGIYYRDFYSDFSMERYEALLKFMDLPEDFRMKKLSTGMMAKLKAAVTLARRAKVYLLDEPLNGVDLLARDAISRVIREAVIGDVSMMISSHMVEELEKLADFALFMKEGKLVQTVDVRQLEADGGNLADLYRSIYSEAAQLENVQNVFKKG